VIASTTLIVENLQRHYTIRVGRPVRPVYDGMTAAPEYRVDDIAREVVADLKHVSQPRPGRGPANPAASLRSASCRR
jgi:hypothetical protein